ncbi:DUF3570 domain-containing protein [Arsukibacterium sp.]|uniref:DUF3570 domain-containing protein n=1 Tax=Arsukibacterium sp. TaxID=1977258 RepID=UPI002FD9A5F3
MAVIRVILTLCFCVLSLSVQSAVLPDNRADLMYHSYQGGGVSIDGPALMLRSNIGQQVSVSGFYLVDTVSGASIDVLATASAYTETRVETRVGIDYLAGDSIVSVNYVQSDESDYNGKSLALDFSHDTFGGMTTLSLGTAIGRDKVSRTGDDSFSDDIRRNKYSIGLTQVLTTSWMAALNTEVSLEQGFLNNPYRQIRYRDPLSELGYSYQSEVYPRTRNSLAVALVNKWFLPYRAALSWQLRHYQDSWDIKAFDTELEYIHPFAERWLFDAHVRWYQQGQAEFYQDLFGFANQQNFMARNKELSEFSNLTLGVGVSYQLPALAWLGAAKPQLNLQLNHVRYDYQNFRNVTLSGFEAGEEPLYQMQANVIRAFMSLYF